MKQLLFLLLFPCLALAQYQGNANQKITLGEQTTADGLVYRGVALTDTVTATSKITRANKQDTSAYLLLDTVTNLLWHYKIGSNAWTQAGGSTLDTATMLLPYYRAGRNTIIQAADVPTLNQNTTGSAATLTTGRTIQTNLASTSAATFNGSANITPGITGTLGGGNGGTGLTTFGAANRVLYSASTTQLTTSDNLTFDETTLILRKNTTGSSFATLPNIAVENPSTSIASFAAIKVSANNNGIQGDILADGLGAFGTPLIALRAVTNHPFSIFTNNTERMRINNDGEVWIGYNTDGARGTFPLQVNGQIFATNATIATSDEKFKENITPLNKGLEIVSKLKPVTFNFISDTENNFSEYEEVGFIAQDVDRALSTETFAKSIVKSANDSEPTSTMGLATQNLIPILVKAIQEQQALIKALEQRILNLENK